MIDLGRPEIPADAVAALRDGLLIKAIKSIRATGNMSLAKAKGLAEEYLKNNPSVQRDYDAALATQRDNLKVVAGVSVLVVLLAALAFYYLQRTG